MLKLLQSVGITLLVLMYPLLVYLAIRYDVSWLVPMLIAAVCLRRFYRSDYSDWKFLLFGILLVFGALFFQIFSAKVIPIFMHMAMFLVFYKTLQTDASLIERFARLDFPDLPPGIPEYCRQVTWLWVGFFAVNVVVCVGLALWADNAVWALYNGVIIYFLLGTLMMSEYVWRKLRFPWLEVKPFRQSMVNMIKNGHTVWDRQDN